MSQETESTKPDPQLPGEEKSVESSPDLAVQENTDPFSPVIPSESQNAVKEPDTNPEETQGLNFIDHLEEIRSRLIKSAIALVSVTAICAIYADVLVNEALIGPLQRSGESIMLQNLVPYGQLSLYFQVVLFAGFIISFPFIAFQIWKFVEPGLHDHERQASRFIILFISLCFFSGIAFGYFVFLPISLKFFAGFGTPLIKNNIAVQDYISFVMGTLLTTGIVFELPFISYILSKIGFLTPAFMRFYRKHAIVTLLVVAAIVTPSTDMVTQLVIGIPMILLYEISIWISSYVNKKNNALKTA
ncbi:MAG: twin-arginine translocase subunit TatC [Chlorobiaceae bacterium]|nr:twin-arginine translocase subunit TatC [Chlorobiaceae bacterium]